MNPDPMAGRRTMKALDAYGWAAAVDAVLEGRVSCPALVEPDRDGTVVYSLWWMRTLRAGDIAYRPVRDHFRDATGRVDNLDYTRAMSMFMQERSRAARVRVRHATETQLADLARAFGSRAVVVTEQRGGKTQYVHVPTFPAASVYAVFAAIWSESFAWPFSAAKYLEGFTLRYCEEHEPGQI